MVIELWAKGREIYNIKRLKPRILEGWLMKVGKLGKKASL